MNITYLKATLADIEIMTDLLFSLYHDEGQSLDLSRDELLEENEQLFTDINQAFFLAFNGDKAVAVSHGSLRREYVNGANDGLKGYLEAIYVLPEYRKNGIAAKLVNTVERWAGRCGCREMASDCLLDNTESYNFHLKIGFEETERNIFFLKAIEPTIYEIHSINETIRLADITDIEQIIQLDNLNRHEQINKAVRHRECYVAEENAEIIGFAIMGYTFFEYGFIELLIVVETRRRQGIGGKMIEYLYRQCMTEKLFTSTNESNTQMQGLLSKTGFVPCGQINALDEGDPELFFVRRKI